MQYDIFISYDKKDKSVAYKVCDYLEQLDDGYKCWIAPRDVPPGWDYPTAIIRAIKNTKIVILILSKHSNTSQMVNREIERAVTSDLPIIPFKIEEVVLSENMEFYISSTQWLDAFPPPIEDHFQKLKNAIPLSSFRNIMVEKEGFCILCRKLLPIADELMEIQQFCKDCYYKYANEIQIGYGIKYENLYCHFCGEKADLSENEITCEKCKSQLPKEEQKTDTRLFFEEEVSFRETIIPESEASFLQEIESKLNQQFTGDKTSVLMKIPSWEREIFFHENEMLFLVEEKRVIRLSVHDKKLTSIPESIENLEELLELDLSNNQIETLPESIGNLMQLSIIDLRNNRLKSLPVSIGNLKNLEYLYLASNQLNELPSSLTELNSLREILLEDNPLSEWSTKILKKLLDNGIRVSFEELKRKEKKVRIMKEVIPTSLIKGVPSRKQVESVKYAQVLGVAELVLNEGKHFNEAVKIVAQNKNIENSTVRDKCTRGLYLNTAEFKTLLRNKEKLVRFLIEKFPYKENEIKKRLKQENQKSIPKYITDNGSTPNNFGSKPVKKMHSGTQTYNQIMEVADLILKKQKNFKNAVKIVANNRNIDESTVRDKCTRQINMKTDEFKNLIRDKEKFINFLIQTFPDKEKEIKFRFGS